VVSGEEYSSQCDFICSCSNQWNITLDRQARTDLTYLTEEKVRVEKRRNIIEVVLKGSRQMKTVIFVWILQVSSKLTYLLYFFIIHDTCTGDRFPGRTIGV
jgi:hypothetical protein